MKEHKEGWQCFVEINDSCVIKKFKTKEQIAKKIEEYLNTEKKSPESLEERTDRVYADIKNSLRILENSNIPRNLLANAKISKDTIKQDKVFLLGDKINELLDKNKLDEAKKLIRSLIDFILELWKYKIHEKTYKFNLNYGVDNGGNIVLIDFLEITDDKEKVKKQIVNKKWDKPERYLDKIDMKIARFLLDLANKELNLDNLEKNWGKYA